MFWFVMVLLWRSLRDLSEEPRDSPDPSGVLTGIGGFKVSGQPCIYEQSLFPKLAMEISCITPDKACYRHRDWRGRRCLYILLYLPRYHRQPYSLSILLYTSLIVFSNRVFSCYIIAPFSASHVRPTGPDPAVLDFPNFFLFSRIDCLVTLGNRRFSS